MEYDVVMSSKGQFVLPKEVRDKFKLGAGSKVKIIIDGEQIILKPRTISDELQDLIRADIAKDGKPVTEQTVKEYQVQLNKALDSLVAEAEQEYSKKEYVSLSDLKKGE
ncbi:MAG: SpoVT / AbrB like domain protein [Firmicutes bacterium]|nr:SpoVT / AbrB like domain protein [Bacillota bacterium]